MDSDLGKLKENLGIPDVRAKLIEIVEFASLLDACIIDANYRLADEWIQPISFTPLGERIINELLENHRRLKPNDVRMATFLQIGCAEGMLIDESTDIERLRRQLSRELLNGRILFPYIFGRDLHDTAARLYPARTTLSNKQTINLLRELPIGVFQAGRTVVGPYGCTYSDTLRRADATRTVPGYLCSDAACDAVHGLDLNTASSPTSRARGILAEYLETHYSQTADEHVPLFHEAAMVEYLSISPYGKLNLLDTIADGLSEEELRRVIDRLLRRTFKNNSRRRDIGVRLGAAIMNPTEFVAGIDRAHLMQIALLHTDEDLISAVDETVSSGEITVRDFEVRSSKVERWNTQPPYAEIGRFGVHFTAPALSRGVPMRMLELLHNIYYESEIWDAGDLAYALEAPNDLNDSELLDRAVRQYTPRELFTRLILPNKRAATAAAEKLGIFGYEAMSRGELLERMLWKIGESSSTAFTDIERVEEHLRKLANANIGRQGVDVLRSHAANLFAALEDALSRALLFCTWALTSDHYLESFGFVYDPALSAEILQFIETNASVEDPELQLRLDGRNSLATLCAGFARLAKGLRRLNADDQRRNVSDIPKESIALSRPFAFPFKVFFLNLNQTSTTDILTALQATSRLLQTTDIIDLRNSFAHGNHPLPSSEVIETACDQISKAAAQLRVAGFYPRTYELSMMSRDGLGRETLVYRSGEDEISLYRPGWAIAPKLPTGSSRLIIIPIARTAASGPLRFTLKDRPGTDPYWENWPKRWHVESSYGDVDHRPPGSKEMEVAG